MRVERIAVLRATALGDYVFAVPALDALRAAHPRAEITLLAKPWHATFLHQRPGPVDRVCVVPPSRGVRDEPDAPEDEAALEAFFAAMQDERFDVALQMHGGGRWSNPFVTRLGAELTAGARDHDAAALDRWIPYVYLQSETARCLEIAGLAGAPPVTIAPRIAVMDSDLESAGDYVERGRFAVIHPGASAVRRRWSTARFAAVGRALVSHGLTVVVTGTEGERELVDAVSADMGEAVVPACGALTLGGLAGLLSRAELLVSNDTGPLHLATAVGCPSVGVYWVGNVINGAPLTRALHRPLASFRVACPVCGQRNVERSCEHEVSFVDDVRVPDVVDAAVDLLIAGRPGWRRS